MGTYKANKMENSKVHRIVKVHQIKMKPKVYFTCEINMLLPKNVTIQEDSRVKAQGSLSWCMSGVFGAYYLRWDTLCSLETGERTWTYLY